MVYIYTNVQLCFNFIFIILVISINFEAQIIYMWSLKLFKVNEILRVAIFETICSSKFASNCVDHSLPTPFFMLLSCKIWRWVWLVIVFIFFVFLCSTKRRWALTHYRLLLPIAQLQKMMTSLAHHHLLIICVLVFQKTTRSFCSLSSCSSYCSTTKNN